METDEALRELAVIRLGHQDWCERWLRGQFKPSRPEHEYARHKKAIAALEEAERILTLVVERKKRAAA